MTRNVFAAVLCLLLIIMNVSSSSAGYDNTAAAQFALDNYQKSSMGLCAEFVWNCLKAGGLDIPKEIYANWLLNKLIKAGYPVIYDCRVSQVSVGDPLFFYNGSSGDTGLKEYHYYGHAAIAAEQNGILVRVQRNSAKISNIVVYGSYPLVVKMDKSGGNVFKARWINDPDWVKIPRGSIVQGTEFIFLGSGISGPGYSIKKLVLNVQNDATSENHQAEYINTTNDKHVFNLWNANSFHTMIKGLKPGNYSLQIKVEYDSSMIPSHVIAKSSFQVESTLNASLASSNTWNNCKYELYSSNYTWAQARDYAKNKGGHLACITSAEEQAAVASLVSSFGKACWLGGYYEGGSWKWLSGEAFSYTNWDSGEPSGGEYYLGIYGDSSQTSYATDKKWNDFKNDSTTPKGFVIEYPPTSTSTPTSTPKSTPTPTPTVEPAATPVPTLKGDATNEGTVDILDLVSIINYIVLNTEPTSLINADANEDGTVDILDLVWIIDQIVGG